MRKLLLMIMMSLVAVNGWGAEELISKGVVYDKEGKEKEFTYERYQEIKGDTVHDRAIYKDMDGDVLTVEKAQIKNGKIIRYDMDQKQLKQEAWIETTDDKVTFNLKKFRKKNYPQTIDRPDNFIVGLQIVPTIHENWDKLAKGDSVEVSLGVWYRQEAIEFKLSHDKEKSSDKMFVVKFNPSSMFIRAVVDPLYFNFDPKTKNLLTYQGRTTPKQKRGRSFYDFDGLTKYENVNSKEEETKKSVPKK